MKKDVIARLVALSLIVATVLLFVVWNAGLISIPLLPPPLKDPSLANPLPDGGEESTGESAETDSQASSPETTDETAAPLPLPVLPDARELMQSGATITDRNYDPDSMTLAKLPLAQDLAVMSISYRNKTVQKVVRKETSQSGIAVSVRTEQQPLYALTPYMGYLIGYAENKTYLIDKTGTVLRDDMPEFEPVYAYDKQNRPIVRMGESYYAITDSGLLTQISFTPIKHMIYADTAPTATLTWPKPATAAVPIFTLVTSSANGKNLFTEEEKQEILSDYPSKVQALSDSAPETEEGEESAEAQYSLKYETRWGYQKSNGSWAIPPIYTYAFPFGTNGCAAVETYHKTLKTKVIHFINTYGGKILDINADYYSKYTPNGNSVYDSICLSVSADEFSLGSYYFEDGFVRVRRRMLISHQVNRAYIDQDMLLSDNGKFLELPEGYALLSYSCGAVLLEKNGRYGYLDTQGNWIAQPTFTAAQPFYCGLAVVQQNGKYGVIDTEGNFVLPAVYDAITNVSQGIFTAYHPDGGWEMLCILKNA